MTITIVTTVYNGVTTIADAMASVVRQRLDRASLEYIVVDGGSNDGTVEKIREFEKNHSPASTPGFRFRWISEKDGGLYDGLNKGVRLATGDVVGICNADDVLASDDVVNKVADGFNRAEHGERVDCVYADIRFVRDGSGVDALRRAPVTRYCTGKYFRRWMFRFATFPAHPSTFLRREWFEKAGWYSLDYGMYGDFEFMLRVFWKHGVRAKYLPICTHVMRSGGASTGSFRKNMEINRTDLRALRDNGCWSCMPLIYAKYLFKVWGFIFKYRSVRRSEVK